jgi:hypothetical protein
LICPIHGDPLHRTERWTDSTRKDEEPRQLYNLGIKTLLFFVHCVFNLQVITLFFSSQCHPGVSNLQV